MQILIIGKNGQVATHLSCAAMQHDYKITQVSSDQFDLSSKASILSFLEDYEASSENSEEKIIINAGAYTNVEEAEVEIERAFQINAVAPGIIASFAKDHGYKLIHYSTDYVFDGTKNSPYLEEDIPRPINQYGKSKLAGEQNIILSGCDYIIFRTSWVFSYTGMNFVKKIINLLQNNNEIKVINDQIGMPTYAGFIADMTFKLLETKKINKEILNICQPKAVSWYGFAQRIKEGLEKKGIKTASIMPVDSSVFKTKASRPKNSVLSLIKLNKIIDDYPIPSWDSSLDEIIDIIMKNENTI